MRRNFILLLLLLLCRLLPGQVPPFAKYFSNTLSNSSFDVVQALQNSNGYIMLGTRYVNPKQTYFIKTDSALNQVWSRRFVFSGAFSNAYFRDIGEFPTGEYYMAGYSGTDYVVLVLDTNGNVLYNTAIHETTHTPSVGWFMHTRICPDSSLLISPAEYEWAGFYRFDRQLNLLSAGFSQDASGMNTSGNSCIMLADHHLLYSAVTNTGAGIVKSTKQGNVLWSKFYYNMGNIFSLCEGSDGSIYIGGNNLNPHLAKVDSSGNLLWTRSYTNSFNNLGTATIRNIFPMTNGHLLLFTDSLFVETDTSGNPVTVSYVLPQPTSLGEMRAAGPDFLFCSQLYNSGPSGYYPTVIRFQNATGSICLWPRPLIVSNGAGGFNPSGSVNQMNPQFVQQSVPFIDTITNFNYDPLPACPNDPLSISENKPAGNSLLAFPNPASTEIRFAFDRPLQQAFTAEVSDPAGKLVFSGTMTGNELRISLAGFAGGLYFIHVHDQDGFYTAARFCVMH